MQFSLKQDFTERFENMMKNWNLNDWTANSKIERVKAEKVIEQRLRKLRKVIAISIERLEGRFGETYVLYLKVGDFDEYNRNQPIENTAFVVESPKNQYNNDFTSLMWWNENKEPINLRTTEGRPFKLKELYNSQ